jgi:uncharacterized protein
MSMQPADPSATATVEAKVSTLTTEHPKDDKFRILSLDGGGAKGFYTLGVLSQIQGMLNCPLHQRFDLVYGTSTGAIIASLIALGYTVEEIFDLYKNNVPKVMKAKKPFDKSLALANLAKDVFGNRMFTDVKTGIGVVAAKWKFERPMIFKKSKDQAFGSKGTFAPGFGVSIADAVQGSCSAYPFFELKTVTTSTGEVVELGDGGYCANNPTLYAIADATVALQKAPADVHVVSVGVGVYPEPKGGWSWRLKKKLLSVQLLQKTLEINTQSMDQLRTVLFKNIKTVRISDTFSQPEMATDLMEHDLTKLNMLYQQGRKSFESREAALNELLL